MGNELPHDKTNKESVHSAKTQISLGIRPVWSNHIVGFVMWWLKYRSIWKPKAWKDTVKILINTHALINAHPPFFITKISVFLILLKIQTHT